MVYTEEREIMLRTRNFTGNSKQRPTWGTPIKSMRIWSQKTLIKRNTKQWMRLYLVWDNITVFLVQGISLSSRRWKSMRKANYTRRLLEDLRRNLSHIKMPKKPENIDSIHSYLLSDLSKLYSTSKFLFPQLSLVHFFFNLQIYRYKSHA